MAKKKSIADGAALRRVDLSDPEALKRALDDPELLESVDRAVDGVKSLSKQPRFDEKQQARLATAVLNWIKEGVEDIPDYARDSRKRDKFLRAFWRKEPHWAATINTMTLIDSSRAWTMIGGRNQVRRYTGMMHMAENGAGYRPFFSKQALSYRVTDMGALTELGRDIEDGPLRALYHLDSARCALTGDPNRPLVYSPPEGKEQEWKPGDFFRVASMPNDDERFNGLGYCATSRVYEGLLLLYAVLQHDQEKLWAKMPKGILTLHNISTEQFEKALLARKARLEGMGREFFAGVITLGSTGQEQVEAKLLALSQLPEGFSREDFINQTINLYAAAHGMDPREFWPVSGGTLGTGRETEEQHRKAATKGALEFPLAFQEQLQRYLPATLDFNYEERDAQGQLEDAQVAMAWAEVATLLYQTGLDIGSPLLDREKALSLLVDRQIIPPEWTEGIQEETIATDTVDVTDRIRQRARQSLRVQKAIQDPVNDNEPIVAYHWTPTRTRYVILWESGFEARQTRVYLPAKPAGRRALVNPLVTLLGEMIAGARVSLRPGGKWYGPLAVPSGAYDLARAQGLIEPAADRQAVIDRVGQRFVLTAAGRALVQRQDPDQVLYADPDGDFEITEADVTLAITEGRARMGDEYFQQLTAETRDNAEG